MFIFHRYVECSATTSNVNNISSQCVSPPSPRGLFLFPALTISQRLMLNAPKKRKQQSNQRVIHTQEYYSESQDPGSWVVWVLGLGSWVLGRGPWMGSSWILDPGSWVLLRLQLIEYYENESKYIVILSEVNVGSVTIIENQERNHSKIRLLNSIAVIS